MYNTSKSPMKKAQGYGMWHPPQSSRCFPLAFLALRLFQSKAVLKRRSFSDIRLFSCKSFPGKTNDQTADKLSPDECFKGTPIT